MSVKPQGNLYLVHQETSQRYPVKGDIVIGRTSGDIVFPDDKRLSSQHCRVMQTPQGWAIHDLKSASGTFLDGAQLEAGKVYALKPGSVVTVGAQTFQLIEASIVRKSKPGKPARKRT